MTKLLEALGQHYTMMTTDHLQLLAEDRIVPFPFWEGTVMTGKDITMSHKEADRLGVIQSVIAGG